VKDEKKQYLFGVNDKYFCYLMEHMADGDLFRLLNDCMWSKKLGKVRLLADGKVAVCIYHLDEMFHGVNGAASLTIEVKVEAIGFSRFGSLNKDKSVNIT